MEKYQQLSVDRPPADNLNSQTVPDAKRCSGCVVGDLCVAAGSDEKTLVKLDRLLTIGDAVKPSAMVVRRGDPFNYLIAVRQGCFKSFVTDRDGREQVQGFHFAGELIGLDAVQDRRFRANVVALGGASLCELDYDRLLELSACSNSLQSQLFRLFSGRLASQQWRGGDFTADERIAAFLLDISARMQLRGACGDELELLMSRSDIANYLGLATETVSRCLTRLSTGALIAVRRKRVTILNREMLHSLAEPVFESS